MAITRRSFLKASVVSAIAASAGFSITPEIALADSSARFWYIPTSPVTVNYESLLKTYGVRAGSAGPDFLGISNTNFDFSAASPDSYGSSEYPCPAANQLTTVVGAGLAIWASEANEEPNPFYTNLMYSSLPDAEAGITKATTWVGNPDASSWGDSVGQTVQNKVDGTATINGLEFSPEIIFGANKKTNWGNADYSSTNIYQNAASSGGKYNPTFTNNDATNLWTQVYTLNRLAAAAEQVKAASTTLKTRYGNDAIACAVDYEKCLRGNLLYVASQVDNLNVKKKTVAYLYAIYNGTGYFFTPEAGGLVNGNDTGQISKSTAGTASTNYAANNGTIGLGYMDALPFVTNTFTNGTPLSGGIVMLVEDIYKANPVVTVGSGQTNALADVDVIIYNSTVNTNLYGSSGGKNVSGINNSMPLNDDFVRNWAQGHGFKGALVIAGDDFGTSSQQGFGGSRAGTESGMAPLLYCQRNYTADKPARAAWVFSKVFPELYPNADASYAYWVNKVYHIKTDQVGRIAAYMTNKSGAVTYDSSTADAMENNFKTGLRWWKTKGSSSATWSQYAYYNGSSRASYFDNNKASEEPTNLIGIFEPTTAWGNSLSDKLLRLYGNTRYATMRAISQQGFTSASTVIVASGGNFPDALSATALAGYYKAPVLLSAPEALSEEASTEIRRLGATHVILVGGTNALSAAVEDSIKALGATTERLYGSTRYDTAMEIYKKGKANGAWGNTAIICTGNNYPDALSISAYAYAKQAPIFLANEGVLTDDAVQALRNDGFTRALIIGGTGVVPDSVASQVGNGISYKRLYGNDRYATSAAVASFAMDEGMQVNGMGVAFGGNFPDALAGGALCGSVNSIIMLAADGQPDYVSTVLGNNKAAVTEAYVFGGNAAVSDALFNQFESMCE